MWQDFKEFALKGNAVDMAIGIIIGGAFGTIVQSLVNDVLMPPFGLMLGNVDFEDLFLLLRAGSEQTPPYTTVAEAQAAGAVTLNYGVFINSIIAFLIIALSMFAVVRTVRRLEREQEASPKEEARPKKECPFCFTEIPIKARRCPNCTSELGE